MIAQAPQALASEKAFALPRFLTADKSSTYEQVLDTRFAQQAKLLDPKALKLFYARRGGKPYWQGFFGLRSEADVLINIVNNAWRHGLNPDVYHVRLLKNLRNSQQPLRKIQFDILLTDAFVRYARDMSGMRVEAAALGLDASDWRRPYKVEYCLALLSHSINVEEFLNFLSPKSQTYVALQKELVTMARQPRQPYESVLPIDLDNLLIKPGQRHRRMPDIRLRLGTEPQTSDKYLYDDRLTAAVLKFQRAHGLKDDGVLGPTTIKLMNSSPRERMLQIIANMERLRWVDEQRPDKFVLVNIPAATLWAIEGSKVAFQMPVIVGKPLRPTQPFIADITGVRFNPDWTVPPTIKREDILPKLREDPKYLADKGMALIYNGEKGHETLDPTDVDWEDVSPAELNKFDMVQIPGAHNPLGRIRVLMPNSYNIYLHDTNQPEYFDKYVRAQSSGCIRMKEPEKMAAFIMKDEKGWSDEKMREVLAKTRTQDFQIINPIPVYILYYTAWADDGGRIVFGNDIYDMDKKLIAKLLEIDGIRIPGDNANSAITLRPSELASVN